MNVAEVRSNNANAKENERKEPQTVAQIKAWLVSYLAEILEMNPNEVDVTVSFNRYGLDSAAAVGLTGDLADWLGCALDPTLLYDYPTIEAVAQHLAKESDF